MLFLYFPSTRFALVGAFVCVIDELNTATIRALFRHGYHLLSRVIQSFWDSPFCGKGSRSLSSSASSRWSSSSISAHVELTVKFVIFLVLFQFVQSLH